MEHQQNVAEQPVVGNGLPLPAAIWPVAAPSVSQAAAHFIANPAALLVAQASQPQLVPTEAFMLSEALAAGPSSTAPSESDVKKAKVRKPYTITKQRERWTDQEHARFLDGLRLYGRQWRRIQEHIGTKTAVQIRSHAQKFFDKVEKEGGKVEGVPEIPPPRPKRKPSAPYPRKADDVSQSARSTSLLSQQPGLNALQQLAAAGGADGPLGAPLGPDGQPDSTVVAVLAAASAAAAAAAAAVVGAAGHHIRKQLQTNPPAGFPFFGMAPSQLEQLSTPCLMQLFSTHMGIPAVSQGQTVDVAATGMASQAQPSTFTTRSLQGKASTAPEGAAQTGSTEKLDNDSSACSRENDADDGKPANVADVTSALQLMGMSANPMLNGPAWTWPTATPADPMNILTYWQTMQAAAAQAANAANMLQVASVPNTSGEANNTQAVMNAAAAAAAAQNAVAAAFWGMPQLGGAQGAPAGPPRQPQSSSDRRRAERAAAAAERQAMEDRQGADENSNSELADVSPATRPPQPREGAPSTQRDGRQQRFETDLGEGSGSNPTGNGSSGDGSGNGGSRDENARFRHGNGDSRNGQNHSVAAVGLVSNTLQQSQALGSTAHNPKHPPPANHANHVVHNANGNGSNGHGSGNQPEQDRSGSKDPSGGQDHSGEGSKQNGNGRGSNGNGQGSNGQGSNKLGSNGNGSNGNGSNGNGAGNGSGNGGSGNNAALEHNCQSALHPIPTEDPSVGPSGPPKYPHGDHHHRQNEHHNHHHQGGPGGPQRAPAGAPAEPSGDIRGSDNQTAPSNNLGNRNSNGNGSGSNGNGDTAAHPLPQGTRNPAVVREGPRPPEIPTNGSSGNGNGHSNGNGTSAMVNGNGDSVKDCNYTSTNGNGDQNGNNGNGGTSAAALPQGVTRNSDEGRSSCEPSEPSRAQQAPPSFRNPGSAGAPGAPPVAQGSVPPLHSLSLSNPSMQAAAAMAALQQSQWAHTIALQPYAQLAHMQLQAAAAAASGSGASGFDSTFGPFGALFNSAAFSASLPTTSLPVTPPFLNPVTSADGTGGSGPSGPLSGPPKGGSSRSAPTSVFPHNGTALPGAALLQMPPFAPRAGAPLPPPIPTRAVASGPVPMDVLQPLSSSLPPVSGAPIESHSSGFQPYNKAATQPSPPQEEGMRKKRSWPGKTAAMVADPMAAFAAATAAGAPEDGRLAKRPHTGDN